MISGGDMKLVTIQTKSAYDKLMSQGYLTCDTIFVNIPKYGVPYGYIVDHMIDIPNKYNADYPLWAWVQYGKRISPPSNRLLGFFPKDEDEIVRITFHKPDAEVLVSDYIKYHFMLTNEYLPIDIQDKLRFDKVLIDKSISKEDLLAYIRRDKYPTYRQDADFNTVNQEIHDSYSRMFVDMGDYKQGTVWYIDLSDIEKVEFIHRENSTKKKSVDYRELYIKSLKKNS